MLMNHSDALVDRIQRIGDVTFLPLNKNLSFLAVLEPKKDLHQSRLSGAVFPDQRMDFALIDREGDILVRHKPIPVNLGDSFHS